MIAFERQKQIMDLLAQKKSLSVKELCERLYASGATIRRDLAALEQSGSIQRVRGGAVILEGANQETPFVYRQTRAAEEKARIAKLALRYIKDNQSIFMDSSTTVLQLARYMDIFTNLSVITNGVRNIMALMERSSTHLYCPMGQIKQSSGSICGIRAREAFHSFHADLALFSCAAISADGTLYDTEEQHACIKQAMLENAGFTVLLCDSSKFSRHSFCRIAHVREIDAVVTDRRPEEEFLALCAQSKTRVLFPNE